MPAFSFDARFLGVDLRDLVRSTRDAWAHAQAWPLLAWLTPPEPVHLIHADGSQTSRFSDGTRADKGEGPAKQGARDFVALELPQEWVLNHPVSLPANMSRSDVEHALALQARTLSPFPAGELLWSCERIPGSRAGQQSFLLVLTSRKYVANHLSQWLAVQPPGTPDPEIWIATGPERYAVLGGYGVPRRLQTMRRKRYWSYALLASLIVLLMGIAVTPSLQLRLRALQAIAAYEAVTQRTTAVVHDREKLVQASTKLQTLSEILNERVEPLRVIDMLTTLLPDDTAVQTLQFAGTKVSMSGHTSDTATIMQKLGQQAGVRNVRAPTAATRLNGAAKENFSIEFELDPAVFGIGGANRAAPAAPSATPVVPAVAGSAAGGSQ